MAHAGAKSQEDCKSEDQLSNGQAVQSSTASDMTIEPKSDRGATFRASIVATLIGLLAILGLSASILASEPTRLELPLALKVGEKVYFARKQGCVSCHGASGSGGKRAGSADLRYPEDWKSRVIAERVSANTNGKIDARGVAIGLITEGAERWNAEFYRRGERSTLESKVFFDEEMIGVHSAAMKRNAKSVLRLLRRNNIKVSRKELPAVMARSVYCYLSREIFDPPAVAEEKRCIP